VRGPEPHKKDLQRQSEARRICGGPRGIEHVVYRNGRCVICKAVVSNARYDMNDDDVAKRQAAQQQLERQLRRLSGEVRKPGREWLAEYINLNP
jgi:hypothetical protein